MLEFTKDEDREVIEDGMELFNLVASLAVNRDSWEKKKLQADVALATIDKAQADVNKRLRRMLLRHDPGMALPESIDNVFIDLDEVEKKTTVIWNEKATARHLGGKA